MKGILDRELSRVRNLFDSASSHAIKDIKDASNNQQELIQQLSSNTVTSCTDMCSDFKDDMDRESSSVVGDMTRKLHQMEKDSLSNCNLEWKQLEAKLKLGHQQLATTNSTVIRNNKILKIKLTQAEERINKLDETISLQSENIKNMEMMLEDNFKRLQQLCNISGSEYKDLVDGKAKEIITGVINEICENKCNHIKEECTALETGATAKFNDILTTSSKLLKNKANTITANVDLYYNRKQPSNNGNMIMTFHMLIINPTLFFPTLIRPI